MRRLSLFALNALAASMLIPSQSLSAAYDYVGIPVEIGEGSGVTELYPLATASAPALAESIVVSGETSTFSHRAGLLVPDTRGQYIETAHAALWYQLNFWSASSPAIEYRYFSFDLNTGEVTNRFWIAYEHQWVDEEDLGVAREWMYDTPMPISYQLGPDEILGVYTVFHTHGGGGFYEYDYLFGGIDAPTRIDIDYGGLDGLVTYYAQVPGPGTLALLSIGAMAVGRRRRR